MSVGADGKITARARGVVPADWVQASQSGEYAALASVVRLLPGVGRVFSDCANVVRDWSNPDKQSQLKRAYGNIASYVKNRRAPL